MPARRDIQKILVIGSGPIQIGQACEFDYSGSQALRALKEQGYDCVLVNSNPATIMTDPEMAARTYIEPLVVESLEKIIAEERPDAILPTLGGQVALNLTMDLHHAGVLKKYKVQMLGVRIQSIETAENREEFRLLLNRLGIPCLDAKTVHSLEEGLAAAETLSFPLILRPSYTLGGAGGGSVYNREDLPEMLEAALRASPTSEVLIEESIAGWKELEYEIMCDAKGQMVVVCHIENVDPMGIHTGDSITVAPIQSLTDKEHQRLREACKKIAEGVGIETGGCNIQFALDPQSDRWVVIEMNPRVSRSSALASKATGFPIAKIAALVAVGFHLDELKNDITEKTPACFEPAIDYVVVKIPRFTFEKFRQTKPLLGTQMKSVGEAMAIGRSFKEAFHKAFHSLEIDDVGLSLPAAWKDKKIDLDLLRQTRFDRWKLIFEYFRKNPDSLEAVQEATRVEWWFLEQVKELIDLEMALRSLKWSEVDFEILKAAKVNGFTDRELARFWRVQESSVRHKRRSFGIESQKNMVDTCAGEFEAQTPYFYFAYEENPFIESQTGRGIKARQQGEPVGASTSPPKSVIVLGSGPNRIGQGVEFDYCCVKAVQAIRDMGFRAVMINCNPETVSTDYDTSDALYFEPLLYEHVQRVIEEESKHSEVLGLICQTGGQTALRLSQELDKQLVLGTPSAQIDRAEDRSKFERLLQKLKLKRPQGKAVKSISGLDKAVKELGFPVLVRPSYVLGGRSMHIVSNQKILARITEELKTSPKEHWPIFVDKFLENAIELDIDCIGDGQDYIVTAVMEHIEEAGIHSGDSSCALPAFSLPSEKVIEAKKICLKLCKELQITGFMNVQLAFYKNNFYVIEVNPRASRSLPFVCKSNSVDWVGAGVKAILGQSFQEQGVSQPAIEPEFFDYCSVKQVVFPFVKFPGTDVLLGPEMRSTGEVMSIGADFNTAFIKAFVAAGNKMPDRGRVFLSVRNEDKMSCLPIAKRLVDLGFQIVATRGTHRFLAENEISSKVVNKVKEGQPHIVDAMINKEIDLVINTTSGQKSVSDSYSIRRTALQMKIPYFTTITGARAGVNSLDRWRAKEMRVYALQDLKQKADGQFHFAASI